MKAAKDLAAVWPMTEWKVRAGEEDSHSRTPIIEIFQHAMNIGSSCSRHTWRISRLRLSKVLDLIPPVVRLLRQSNLRTMCKSAPREMRSSIADNCEETSYDASRSV